MIDINVDLLQWSIDFLIKKTSGGTFKSENISNKESAEELYKPIIKKFKKRKVHSAFIDNIQGADFADMQLISKFNKGFRVIDIYSKYAWVIPLKDKKTIPIANAFQKVLHESNRKPNKIWVDKGSKFCNRSVKSWFEKNTIEMYSIRNEQKSIIAKRFVKTLKDKICKYMTSISTNVQIDKLDDLVNKYLDTYHSKNKMKPVNVKSNTYMNTFKEINNKDPKFKISDIARIPKYKHIFGRGYVSNWSKEVSVNKNVKSNVSRTYVISDLRGEEIVGTFWKKELQKTNQKGFRVEKVITRKGDKLYIKWKGYDNYLIAGQLKKRSINA